MCDHKWYGHRYVQRMCAVYYLPNKVVLVCSRGLSVCHMTAGFGKQYKGYLSCYSKAIQILY